MRVEEFMNSEVYKYLLSKDNDFEIDQHDLEAFLKGKEEIVVGCGEASSKDAVLRATKMAIEEIKSQTGEKKAEGLIVSFVGEILMIKISDGIDLIREALCDEDAKIIFLSKYINSEDGKVRVDILAS